MRKSRSKSGIRVSFRRRRWFALSVVAALPVSVWAPAGPVAGAASIDVECVGGAATRTATLACVPTVPGEPPDTETITWLDSSGGTTTVLWTNAVVAGQTVVETGLVMAGRYLGDSATKITSGVSYVGSVVGCLLGTPISSTSGLIDSLLLTS